MSPRFAEFVDPVFEYVLELLERIENNETVSETAERDAIREFLLRADANLGSTEQWQLAKYALVCWVDEVLIAAEWQHREWWMNSCLEFDLCGSNVRATHFFERAREAMGTSERDALEVYFLAVILGFRGVYDSQDQATLVAAYGLPETLSAWVRLATGGLAVRRPLDQSVGKPAPGAESLHGKRLLVTSLLIAVATAGVVLPTLWWALSPGTGLFHIFSR